MFGLNFGSLLCFWLGHVPDGFTIEVHRGEAFALCKNCDRAIKRTGEFGTRLRWTRVVSLPE